MTDTEKVLASYGIARGQLHRFNDDEQARLASLIVDGSLVENSHVELAKIVADRDRRNKPHAPLAGAKPPEPKTEPEEQTE